MYLYFIYNAPKLYRYTQNESVIIESPQSSSPCQSERDQNPYKLLANQMTDGCGLTSVVLVNGWELGIGYKNYNVNKEIP